MWLPLALADVVFWLKAVVVVLGDKKTREVVKLTNRSETLKGWCLPLMGEAVAEDEARVEESQRRKRRESLFDDIMELAKRMGATVTEEKKV